MRALLVVCALLALSLLAAPAGRAVSDGPQSVTFLYTGNCVDVFQYWTVPPNVNWITVTAWGGSGGHNKHTGAGGLGGWAKAPIQVTPGEQLALSVGGWGDAHGGCGWARGGERGYAEGGDLLGRDGYGGGSASVVFEYLGPGNIRPLLVAGGGGGGGGNGAHGGGDGGASSASPAKGEGGHGTWGGGGGCGGCRAQTEGTPGGDEHAGAGGGGGGGGGGYPYSGAGGNGGGEGGGGGGGAGISWAADGIGAQLGTSDRACPHPDSPGTCNGLVTISWDTHPAKIGPSGGDGQHAPVGGVFAQRLAATVTNAEGYPVEGAKVTFTLPAGGASGVFTSGQQLSATAVTNADGVAVSPILEANGVAGSWRASASAPGASAATFQLLNTAATTVTHVTSQANPSVAGQPVAFTAQIATTTTPFQNWSGTVRFEIDGAPIGSPVPVSSDGTATSGTVRLGIGRWPVGDRRVVAIYSGDRNHQGSRSDPLVQSVLPATTATAVSTSPSPSTTGQRVTVTARVTAQAASQSVPDGSVSFYVADVPRGPTRLLATASLDASGAASAETVALGADGPYAIEAVYAGTASYSRSTGTATQNVGADATATLVTSSVNPSVFGEPFELTATVARSGGAGAAPDGSVTFTAGRLQLCGPTPVSEDGDRGDGDGQVTCAIPGGLAARPTPISAVFIDPDGGYRPSTGALTQQITSAASRTTVTAAPERGTFGGETRLRARVETVAPGSGLPRGTVQFYVDDLAVGLPVEVLDGVAQSDAIRGLTVGAHRLSASFEDDSDPLSLLPSTGALTYHVQRAPTTLAIASSSDPAPYGEPLVLTAHASAEGDAGPVAGDVQFLVDGAAVGGPVPLRDGVARSEPLVRLGTGAHTVVAELHGGIRFAPATATFVQHVGAAPPAPPPPPHHDLLPPPAPPARATATIETSRVDASPDGVVNLVLACSGPRGGRCGGSLELASATRLPARLVAGGGARGWRAAGVRLGRAAYAVPVGELRAVRVSLSRAAKRVLVARGGVRLTASATQASGAATARRAVRVLAVRAPALRVDPRAVTLSPDGRIGLRARCAEAWARCTGTLTVARVSDGRTLGSARVDVPGGPVRTVRVALDATARRAVVAAGTLRVRARAVTTLPAGRATKSQRELTVLAPAAPPGDADATGEETSR